MRGLKLLLGGKKPHQMFRIHHGCVDWNISLGSNTSLSSFASITDAWIETGKNTSLKEWQTFASITDAWIETCVGSEAMLLINSHPSRMRGLKLCNTRLLLRILFRIHHGCVDWNLLQLQTIWATSHPSRMRGLKHASKHSIFKYPIRIHHGCVDWNCHSTNNE